MSLREFAFAAVLGMVLSPAFAQPNINAIVSPREPQPRHFPGCTVGATSGSCLAAGVGYNFVQIQNTHATNAIACAWGTAAVLNSAGSIQLAPGQAASWGPMTGGIPNGGLNCIASGASTPMYLEWN
jgi:hypothetical protein